LPSDFHGWLILALLIVMITFLFTGWMRYRQLRGEADRMTQSDWEGALLQVIDTICRLTRASRQWISLQAVQRNLPATNLVVLEEAINSCHRRGYLEMGNRHRRPTSYAAWIAAALDRLPGKTRLSHTGQALCERYQQTGDLGRAVMDFENRDKLARYNITFHTAGQVNIDTTVNNIQSHIQSIGQHGDSEMASVLAQLTNAAMQSGFDDHKLAQVLDALEDVSDGAKSNPTERKLPRITRAIEFIGSAASATTALGKVWTEYGHVVERLLTGQ